MTMEDRSGGIERGATVSNTMATSKATICEELPSDASYPVQRTSNKRSFDVAFLVAPDENLVRRQSAKLRVASIERLSEEIRKDRAQENDRVPQNLTVKHYEAERSRSLKTDPSIPSNGPYMSPRTLTPTLPGLSPEPEGRRYPPIRLQKTPSPPFPHHQPPQTVIGRCGNEQLDLCCPERQHGESRSAFTKVILGSQRNGFEDSQTSPRSSISPDRLSYQSSISPPVMSSLPNMAYKYASNFSAAKMPYPFLVTSEAQQSGNILENLKIPQIAQHPKAPSPKMNAFRPELPSMYQNLPYNPMSAVFPPMAEALARPRFLATAGVAGLLPPSFAALALPAQNVCAKCNLSFRMTSDLVYHMRSHHKSESIGEAARRRREDKLRCPVCDESFRERHHLTRHMTAHQDKESDAIVDQVEVKRRAATVHGK